MKPGLSLCSAGIAERVSQDSFGLNFGVNRFIYVVIQTLMTLLVTDKRAFGLDGADLFKIYGIYYFGAFVFFALLLTFWLLHTNLWKIKERISQNPVFVKQFRPRLKQEKL